MIVLLQESEEIREDLLVVILSALGRKRSVSISSIYHLIKMTLQLFALWNPRYLFLHFTKVFVLLL